MSKNNLLDAMIAQTKLSKKQTDKQQKITETAIKLFAEKGFANTSTSEIAKAAGVAEGTIFRHYGTKDNLLLSVLLPFLKESLPTMAEDVFNELLTDQVANFEDFLRALAKNRIAFINENKEIFQIFVKEVLYSEELKNEIFPYISENIFQRIAKVVDHFKARGELVDLPTITIQRLLFTIIGGFLFSRFVLLPNQEETIDESEIDQIVQFIMDGIRKKSQSE
ncbi:TetR family transcriptional regulator [Bacillus oleivorans]|uniref:TetR family transcriptional regulator n=1 Tax=Bacillus oleivorans TaxID=1448271 RepID=A0A285D412_9BACI|nr:TetR/AcrR family transcriptional regulator [Bacillus oleivorans]SNX74519.1 TetR family transcriptional regulator [Bacillus oleivorans]